MSKIFRPDSTFMSLLIAVLLASAVTFLVSITNRHETSSQFETAVAPGDATGKPGSSGSGSAPATQSAGPAGKPRSVASAAGRVEPKGGEINLTAAQPARVVEVRVAAGDRVRAGDLLVKLDDGDLQARYRGAEAEAMVRQRERDEEVQKQPLALERRQATDQVNIAERAVFAAWQKLDVATAKRQPSGTESPEETAARAELAMAQTKLNDTLANLRRVEAIAGMPLPTRLEASLAEARSDAAALRIAIRRVDIRAPADMTVLKVNARVGELATGSPEMPVVTLGDLTQLQVRAEVEEGDVSQIKVGQAVAITGKGAPGQDAKGRVASIGQVMTPSRLGSRVPGRASDFDVLETIIDLAPGSGFKPGMRVDVFFKPDTPVASTGAAVAN